MSGADVRLAQDMVQLAELRGFERVGAAEGFGLGAGRGEERERVELNRFGCIVGAGEGARGGRAGARRRWGGAGRGWVQVAVELGEDRAGVGHVFREEAYCARSAVSGMLCKKT